MEVMFVVAGKKTPCARLGTLISRNGGTTADATTVGDTRAKRTAKKILRSSIFVQILALVEKESLTAMRRCRYVV